MGGINVNELLLTYRKDLVERFQTESPSDLHGLLISYTRNEVLGLLIERQSKGIYYIFFETASGTPICLTNSQ